MMDCIRDFARIENFLPRRPFRRSAAVYNPNQPRLPAGDRYGGRWTSTGIGGGAAGGRYDPANGDRRGGVRRAGAGAAALGLGHAVLFDPRLAPAVLAMLARIAATAYGPLGFLGALLVPTYRSLISEGELPNNPDIRYRHDAGTGVLMVTLALPTGQELLIFNGHADADGLYRLPDGEAIGRKIDGGILLNEAAAEKEKRRRLITRTAAIAEAIRRGTEIEVRDEPQVCPAPTDAKENNKNPDWGPYQEQVTKMSRRKEILLNGVRFDGCENVPGEIVLKEAKGPGYSKHLKYGELPHWYDGTKELAVQLKRQSIAAEPYRVEWHVAEEALVPYIRSLAQELGCTNIEVIHTPYKLVSP
jgi:hypothetical protein